MNQMKPDEKVCPFCAEIIKAKAIKCKFCHSNLTNKSLAKVNGDIKGAVFFLWASWIFNILTSTDLNNFSDTAQILALIVSFLINSFITKKLLEGSSWVRIVLLICAVLSVVYIVYLLISGNVENGITSNEKIIEIILSALIVISTFLLFTKESSAYFEKSSNFDGEIEDLKECPICTKKRLGEVCQCGFIFKVEKELQNERVIEKPKFKLRIYSLFLIVLFAIGIFFYSKQIIDNNSNMIPLDEFKATVEKDKKVEFEDSSSNIQDIIDNDTSVDISIPDEIKDVFKSITKNCPSPVSEKDVLISDMLLYADQKNKVLVYLGRGSHSSDLSIFNFKDNSFTNINNNYPENNQLHKISKIDLDRLPVPGGSAGGCNFKNVLQVEKFFNCNSKAGSFNCKWDN
jgi:hypothetical protein